MDIGTRLYRILKATAGDQVEKIEQIVKQGGGVLDEFLTEWEKKHGLDEDSQKRQQTGSQSHANERTAYERGKQYQQQRTETVSNQLEEDLGLFGLSPPASLQDVKKARNREIKKFHPDKFQHDSEKAETAKRILQIYNAAYERLKKQLG